MRKPPIRIKQWAFAVLILSTLGGTAAEAITYNVNETITGPLNNVAGNPSQTDSVVGTVTTDGTIGVLHAPNLVGWDLNLIDVTNPLYSDELTTANSSISVDLGSVLFASATSLSFDFDNTGIIAFQANSPGAFSGYHYWCLSEGYGGYCLDGNSIAPDNVYAGVPGDDLVVAATGTEGQVGNSPLDQGGSSSVPEPSTVGLIGLGLAGLGMARRRKTG